jgi:hypothetical protein
VKYKTKALKKKLNKLWSLAVRKKYPRCVLCGSSNHLQAHHAIVRRARSLATRWDIRNGIALCVKCHLWGIHGNQNDKVFLDRYISILNDLIPSEIQDELVSIGSRVNKPDLEEIKIRLEEALK